MFTGIIEGIGTIQTVESEGSNKIFWIDSELSAELKVDQSLSHNGVCLTVDEVRNGTHRITAIQETLGKTTLNSWIPGTRVNLERCLKVNDRLDGHIVQGHVDTVATCIAKLEKNGSYEFSFELTGGFESLVIEKGSIAINGISLTLFNVASGGFTVGIIPYTFRHTNMQQLQVGELVNIEFDMVGKYITRFLALKAE